MRLTNIGPIDHPVPSEGAQQEDAVKPLFQVNEYIDIDGDGKRTQTLRIYTTFDPPEASKVQSLGTDSKLWRVVEVTQIKDEEKELFLSYGEWPPADVTPSKSHSKSVQYFS